MRRLGFLLIGALVVLSGCDALKSPRTGYIEKMPYEAESYWYSDECMMRSVPDKNGFTTCIMWTQTRHVDPPSWHLCFTDDKNPKINGCIEVPESVYNKYQVGYHYPNPM